MGPEALFRQGSENTEYLQDVKGQEEISAPGNHHLLMMGQSGSGKTMLARRFVTILTK